ncbi:hypothetical protein ACOME3_009736 [Neoechinorhynchus agilis]
MVQQQSIPPDKIDKLGNGAGIDIEYYQPLQPIREKIRSTVSCVQSSTSTSTKSTEQEKPNISAKNTVTGLAIGTIASKVIFKDHGRQMGRHRKTYDDDGEDDGSITRRSSSLPLEMDRVPDVTANFASTILEATSAIDEESVTCEETADVTDHADDEF